MQLEQRGIPAVVLTTTRFVDLTTQVAESYGLPGCRVVVVDHPLGGTAEQTLLGWADAAVERIVALFTS